MDKKTKLGISVGMISGLCYFLGFFSLISSPVLLASFVALAVVLISVDAVDAKKNATQATVFFSFIWFVQLILGTVAGWIDSFGLRLMDKGAENYNEVLIKIGSFVVTYNLFDGLKSLLTFVAFVFTVIFLIAVAKGKTPKIPVVTKKVDKAFNTAE